MLYIDKIVIHNFKSFKKAEIKFTKGFNCIVGPNGAGKSNICDALLFGLGETSLKRMRVNKTVQLINDSKDKENKSAKVMVNLTGDSQLDVYRSVDKDSKIEYKLNGKKVHKQDIIDSLNASGAVVGETNTITQGEIIKMLNLSPKERRELLDTASGIKEFDDKKDDAIIQLDLVGQKIENAKVLLNERLGFLSELKKEKDDAESYLKLSKEIKNINYTILKRNHDEISDSLNSINSKIKSQEDNLSSLNEDLSKLDTKLSGLSTEHNEVYKTINAKSENLKSITGAISNIDGQIATQSANLENYKKSISELKDTLKIKENELGEINKSLSDNKVLINDLNDKLKELDANFKNYESTKNEKLDDYKNSINEYDSAILKLSDINEDYTNKKIEFEKMNSNLERIKEQIRNSETYEKDNENKISQLKLKLKSLLNEISNYGTEIKDLKNNKIELSKLFDDLNVETINLREKLSFYGGAKDEMNDELKNSLSYGFYGRAYELCNYDNKYSEAISAAAGSRLNYFVVDSIEVANKAISILKRKLMGRASFIPIKDVKSDYQYQKSLTPIINYISFDDEFRSAFEYIFSNTYLINNINDAKKYGLGRYRFVTLEGELVEPSGIVTGGRSKAGSIIPGKLRIDLLEKERKRDQMKSDINSIDNRINEVFRELSVEQAKREQVESEIQNYSKSDKGELDSLKSNEAEIEKSIENLKAEIKGIESNKVDLESKISALKSKKLEYNQDEFKELDELRDKISEIKLKVTSISKENEIKSERKNEIMNDIGSMNERIKMNSDEIVKINKLINSLNESKEKNKKMLDEEGSEDLYNKLKSLEKDIETIGFEKGKLQSKIDQVQREINEVKSKKVELSVRFEDINAELSTFDGMSLVEGDLDKLQKDLSNKKSEISNLGNVNLKAPEMYESKSKEVTEVSSKLNILQSEKDSIMNMINELEAKKLEVFNDTFELVNKNFQFLYQSTFDKSARLKLDNLKDVFNSGLTITVEKSNGREESIDLLSGGEKSFTLIIFLFAMLMRNPMSFYIFDEIDSALDKENSKKLSMLIKKMSEKSQFIVVSHNDTLITSADAVIGFVNQNDESKAVGIRLVDMK